MIRWLAGLAVVLVLAGCVAVPSGFVLVEEDDGSVMFAAPPGSWKRTRIEKVVAAGETEYFVRVTVMPETGTGE